MKRKLPALEIRFQFVDGSMESFIQTDSRVAEATRNVIAESTLFAQSRIVVADEYSKSVFVASQINRVDLIFKDSGFPKIPPDHVDLVEITEAEFRELVPVHNPARLEKRQQRRRVGDLLVSFLDIRLKGRCHVYLMNEILLKLPAESQSFMQRLLSKGVYPIRLRGGGQGFINLQNLVGYTVYPGVPEVPADTWIAIRNGHYGTCT